MKVIWYMKHFAYLIVLFFSLMAGYGDNPVQADSLPPLRGIAIVRAASTGPPVVSDQTHNENNAGTGETTVETSAGQLNAPAEEYEDNEKLDYADDALNGERVEIADPIEPFNRVMYHFNDKLYFWVLKPVAQGYSKVVPESGRISVKNFFTNLGAPVRFLSCLIQADFSGAATEIGRFSINTLWGIGGLMDPAASRDLNLRKQETDLGQTLGVYGVGHGFYIVWPVLGPSSPRDAVDIAGDYFLYPVSYISPWYAAAGVRSYEIVNAASLRIGDYESLKEAAIDPYVSMRDAYIQYRMKKVKERRAKSLLFKTGDAVNSTAQPSPQK